VHQEDSHKNLMINRDDQLESAAAFSISSTDRTPMRVKGTCNHCGKYGHEETSCFEAHVDAVEVDAAIEVVVVGQNSSYRG